MKTETIYAFAHRKTGFILRVDVILDREPYEEMDTTQVFFSESQYDAPWTCRDREHLERLQSRNLDMLRYGDFEDPGNHNKVNLAEYQIVALNGAIE